MNDYLCSGRTEYQTTQTNRARRSVQFERRPSQRYARRQSHVVRERQQRDRNTDDTAVKGITMAVSADSAEASLTPSPQPTVESTPKTDVDQDLIILDSSHEESNTSGSSSNGLIVGLNKSPQLHARSLLKTPVVNHKSHNIETSLSAGAGTDDIACAASSVAPDHRFDELIKNLAKETMTIQLEEANEKDRLETASQLSKLNTVHINIPNNQSVKSTNQGSAKPLAPDQYKCNILKGRSFVYCGFTGDLQHQRNYFRSSSS